MPSIMEGIQASAKIIKYPEYAKNEGIVGTVFVKAFIDENGDVVKVEHIKGIEESLDNAAINAVQLTKFEPGRQNGKPIKVQVAVPIMLKLQ